MNVEINEKEKRDLVLLICNEQVQMVKNNPKCKIYESDKYKRLEAIKVKLKTAR